MNGRESMSSRLVFIEKNLQLDREKVIRNLGNDFFIDFLKPYCVFTKDGQYLFVSTQPGKRPARAFYMVPPGYGLGAKQKSFDLAVGKRLYQVAMQYLREAKVIVQESIQGGA